MENGHTGRITANMVLNAIRRLEQQGLVDRNLRGYYEFRQDDPRFIETLIQAFLDEVASTFHSMFMTLNADVVNFRGLSDLCIKVKGVVDCFGATRMRRACTNLFHASENASKPTCVQAFIRLVSEFVVLRSRLEFVLSLERALLAG
ncbi:uncharacterized protein LOC135151164 [Daucus carota subsp. sativus]|uniref:uncharacterized protein LOC135151164 n=1 Tax=Daucus carota subsp. sativus TaxID=79200 RepID=UPI0030829397